MDETYRSHSERTYGLPLQPGPLCYHIDFGVAPNIQSGNDAEAFKSLETLRGEIERLRAWGTAWKAFALDGLEDRPLSTKPENE